MAGLGGGVGGRGGRVRGLGRACGRTGEGQRASQPPGPPSDRPCPYSYSLATPQSFISLGS